MYQNNLKALSEFYEKDSYGVCLLEGLSGSYKTVLLNESLKPVMHKMLIFRFRCFEASTIDDVFLAFFEDLKKYSQKKRITLKKIETNSISQRINNYLASLNLPAIIIIDSIENIFNKNNSSEKEEFLRYIEHLNSIQKFKIVLVASSFTSISFEFNNYTKIQTSAFSKKETADYFTQQNLKFPLDILDKLYNITKGNQNLIHITAGIITMLKVSPATLVEEFLNKKISYENFIIQKLISFVPENVKKMLNTLSFLNVGICEKYLIEEKFFSAENLNYLKEKDIICSETGVVFLKNSLKKYLQSSITNFERIKIHTLWRDFYKSQLPLKPNERAVLISRNTMRAQIEYHSSFIIAQKSPKSDVADLSLMSYLNSNLTAWNIKNTNIDDKNHHKSEKTRNRKDNQFEKYALTKEELALLSVPIDMRKKEDNSQKKIFYRTREQQEDIKLNQKPNQTLKELFDTAIELEHNHDFETAFIVFAKAMAMQNDSDFYEYEPILLEKLAVCAKKMNKTVDAIDFYNKLTDVYAKRNDIDKMNEVRLEIAQIYKETYKINHARVIYENFINKKSPATNNILARSYLELAGIEEELTNIEKSIEYYKKAFGLINEGAQLKPAVLAQAYFKYALILDDFNQTQAALDFYQRSIRTEQNENIYLSSAYTNIASIVKESGNLSKAAEYYKQALQTDLKNSNYEGVYYLCLKLAVIYEELAPQKVVDFLKKSLVAAKKVNDPIYITNAYIELGDYYSTQGDAQKAFDALSNAKQHIPETEDSTGIDLRLKDLQKSVTQDTIQKHGER